ncbi:MAG: hypothetical protein U0175_01790 [Caldilineaceae bacterium]
MKTERSGLYLLAWPDEATLDRAWAEFRADAEWGEIKRALQAYAWQQWAQLKIASCIWLLHRHNCCCGSKRKARVNSRITDDSLTPKVIGLLRIQKVDMD